MAQEETIGQLGTNGKLYSNTADKAERTAEKAAETGSKLINKGKEAISNFGQQARRVGSDIADRTDGALSNVGERISCAAESLRENAPAQGTFGTAAGKVADSLDASGHYLATHGVSDISKDVTGVVRRYPMYSLLVGLGIGVVLGRAFASKK